MHPETTAPESTLLQAYTIFHVAISLLAILSGFVVLFGMLANKRLDGRTKFFLITTVLTSVTGFFFPFHGLTPGIVVGVISLVVLALAIFARYPRRLAGAWCKIYVITAVIALYLNVFVLIVQSFMKIPALKSLAPTQTEPPFKMSQLAVLVLFILLGILAALRFHPNTAPQPAAGAS
jgi:hypothetical protein